MAGNETTGDEPARLTPYELVFGPELFEAERFPQIREEIEARDVDATDPGRFVLLAAVGALIRDLLPEDAPQGASRELGTLIFHAYNFWRFEKRFLVLEQDALRHLTDSVAAIGAWQPVPPHPAGYAQLPRNLFWARTDAAAPPEPVDGFFWTMVGEPDPALPPFRRLDALLILGMRPDRAGLSTLAVGEALPAEDAHWGDVDARPDGPDFGNILPGGELDELRAFVTPFEVLKLVSRVFWYVANRPEALQPPAISRATASEPDSPHALPPSSLPSERVVVVGSDG